MVTAGGAATVCTAKMARSRREGREWCGSAHRGRGAVLDSTPAPDIMHEAARLLPHAKLPSSYHIAIPILQTMGTQEKGH